MQNNLIYKISKNKIISDMQFCMRHTDVYEKNIEKLLISVTGEILTHASNLGYHGNLWKCFLAEQIAMDTNAYARRCEKIGEIYGTMNEVALHDIKSIYQAFMYDFELFEKTYPNACTNFLIDYKCKSLISSSERQGMIQQVETLSIAMNNTFSAEEMKTVITKFYQQTGVGMFGLYKAFRINDHKENKTDLLPIQSIEPVLLEDLVGYDLAKQKLIANTEAFIAGRPANNCLLFGDAGTGKSSSIKGILNAYYGDGLRIVEIYKHQFKKLNDIMEILKDRNYRFIIYMDDLSFEDFEIEYKYLKGVIEGGLACKENNILIYATSNRRHLIRENYTDKEEIREDMHTSDTVQEKLSLVARFGVSIFFCRPNRKEFQRIVTTLAKRYHISMSEEDLLYEANRWELSHGGLSGRTAKQFIDYIRGEKKV